MSCYFGSGIIITTLYILSEGIDTKLSERSSRFYGGQRKSIGVANALNKDSQVLIIDGAAALDNITAKYIINAILLDESAIQQ